MAKTAPADVANRLKALIHLAKKDLGLADSDYRAILVSLTGKDSSKDMNLSELNRVVEAFIAKGFKVQVKTKPNPKVKPIRPDVKVPTTKPRNNDPRLSKIWKLFYLLRAHGQTSGSSAALNAFIKRQTGVEKMEWLKTPEQYESVIEGLKGWCKREGIRLEN